MKKNIWIISQSNSHILTQIISDNLMILGLIDNIHIVDSIDDKSSLKGSFKSILDSEQAVVYYVFEDKSLSKACENFCIDKEIPYVDVHKLAFSYFYKMISQKINHRDSVIFDAGVKDDFLSFALDNDDGKKPNNMEEADFVIIGISRTTKTPLSIYLSNHGYKVANLPLVPEVKVPDNLFEIDRKKIFALEMNPQRLSSIRKERLKSLGLPSDSMYASIERISEEINYAKSIIDKLGCKTIDVSSLSIEETADVIINTIKVRKG
ncbi:MAG: kinase/pyrophosphorylase [Tissierellia bacterium]|nr:kinase/pyrophosphorylase [Tissierellia bacterium]